MDNDGEIDRETTGWTDGVRQMPCSHVVTCKWFL